MVEEIGIIAHGIKFKIKDVENEALQGRMAQTLGNCDARRKFHFSHDFAL
jgi:hypothetical protein